MTLWTIFGGSFGFVAVIALSMFSIGALLQTSLVWLTVLEAGAAPISCGWASRCGAPGAGRRADGALSSERGGWSLFRRGALSAMTNPRASCSSPPSCRSSSTRRAALVAQFLIMAGTFAGIEAITEFVIASIGAPHPPWLERSGKRFNQACGGIFIAIGAALPLRA